MYIYIYTFIHVLKHTVHNKFIYTAPKFNIDPEKWWLEDYFPIGKVTFQGRTVKLRGGILNCFFSSTALKLHGN